jgi:threonine dehydratase
MAGGAPSARDSQLGRSAVEAAAAVIRGKVVSTPVVRSAALDRIAGAELWLKAEGLQKTGSYKARGAMHALARLSHEQRASGVIAQSTGNHASAIALAACEHQTPATVVLPADAPPGKIAQASGLGARIVVAGTSLEDREQAVAALQDETGGVVIDAYDHPDVVTGQGTATLELLEEVERRSGAGLDAVVVPVGGGGGLAGACLAAAGRGVAVWGVEPWGCDSLAQSLIAGERVAVPPGPTLADGLKPARVGGLAFEIAARLCAGCVRVDDAEIGEALTLALLHAKLLLEPSGAAGLATALRGDLPDAPRRIGVLLTGANVEPAVLAGLLDAHASAVAQAEDARCA